MPRGPLAWAGENTRASIEAIRAGVAPGQAGPATIPQRAWSSPIWCIPLAAARYLTLLEPSAGASELDHHAREFLADVILGKGPGVFEDDMIPASGSRDFVLKSWCFDRVRVVKRCEKRLLKRVQNLPGTTSGGIIFRNE